MCVEGKGDIATMSLGYIRKIFAIYIPDSGHNVFYMFSGL